MATGIYPRSKTSNQKRSITALKNGVGKWMVGRKHTEEQKQKISRSMKGIVSKLRGRKASIETRRKLRDAQLKRVMEGRHNNYKGGISSRNSSVRNSLESRLWREAVFKRDDWTCVMCSERGCKLNADHIFPFAYFPELRFSLRNGRTLCEKCHKTTDTYGNKAKRYEPTFVRWIEQNTKVEVKVGDKTYKAVITE